jgi:hypothetical protein
LTDAEPQTWETGLTNDIIFAGLDVHKATVAIAVAEGVRGGEALQLGTPGELTSPEGGAGHSINFVQMPDRMRLGAALSQLEGDHRSEMIHPTSDCLAGRRHSTLREQIFDVAEAQCEPGLEPNRLLNDLRREMAPAVADFLLPPWLPGHQRDRKFDAAWTIPGGAPRR